ncbi:MAG TPA: SMR family transporter [Burkholderiaceae bacterium]|nr:SMR family transporter [Burkholderiaceae bacterium]
MNVASFALVLTGVLLNAFAQSLLKLGANRLGPEPFAGIALWEMAFKVLTQWPYLLGFTFYGVSLVVWILALTRVPVTIAYPMLSIGYIINALVARFWLGESLSVGGWMGIALICGGVVLIARAQ